MKYFILFILILFFALIESSFIAIPFVLLVVLSWSVYGPVESRFWLALGAGLVIDSVLVRPFGATSVFFLILTLVVSRYQNKMQTRNILYLALISLVATGIYQYVFTRAISVGILVSVPIFMIPVAFCISILSRTRVSRPHRFA